MHFLFISNFLVVPLVIKIIDYDIPVSGSILNPPQTLAGFLLIFAIAVSSIFMVKKDKIISFAAVFFVITVLPQSSIIPKPDLVVEHRLYLPMAGFAIFLPCIFYLVVRKKEFLVTVLPACMIIFYGFLTYQRNIIWNDPLTLWNDTVIKSPGKARPYLNRGLAYAQKGNIENALKDYTVAIKLNPWYVEAYNNRGIILALLKRYNEAFEDFNRAIEIKPHYAISYNNRGVLYSTLGQWEQAFRDFGTALQLKPDYVDALKNRGAAFLIQKNYQQAIDDFSRAIEIHPKNGELYNYRAIAFLFSGKKEEAIKDARRSLKSGYPINEVLKNLIN